MSWKNWWHVEFNGVELLILTPLFGLIVSDGSKNIIYAHIWWGLSIYWGRVKNPAEFSNLFKYYKNWTFRSISMREIYKSKSLISAYKQGIL